MDAPATRLNLAIGLCLLAALIAAFVSVWTRAPQASTANRLVLIDFADVTNLRVGNRVRVLGADFGAVVDLAVVDGRARVSCLLPGSIDLRRDAVARLRPKTPLGGRFIDIAPGSAETARLAPMEVMRGESGAPDPMEMLSSLSPIVPKGDSELFARLDTLASWAGPLLKRAAPLPDKYRAIRAETERVRDLGRKLRGVASASIELQRGLASSTLPDGERLVRISERLTGLSEALPGLAPKAPSLEKLGRLRMQLDELATSMDGQGALLDEIEGIARVVARFDELLIRRLLQEEGVGTLSKMPEAARKRLLAP